MGQKLDVKPGNPFILSITLEDGNSAKYVQCVVKKMPTGASLLGSPFSIPHESNGKYTLVNDGTLVFPDDGLTRELHAHFTVYDDALFTERSKSYGGDTDVYQGNPGFGSTGASPSFGPSATEIIGVVEDVPLVGHVTAEEDLMGAVNDEEVVGWVDDDSVLDASTSSEPEVIGIIEEE